MPFETRRETVLSSQRQTRQALWLEELELGAGARSARGRSVRARRSRRETLRRAGESRVEEWGVEVKRFMRLEPRRGLGGGEGYPQSLLIMN